VEACELFGLECFSNRFGTVEGGVGTTASALCNVLAEIDAMLGCVVSRYGSCQGGRCVVAMWPHGVVVLFSHHTVCGCVVGCSHVTVFDWRHSLCQKVLSHDVHVARMVRLVTKEQVPHGFLDI